MFSQRKIVLVLVVLLVVLGMVYFHQCWLLPRVTVAMGGLRQSIVGGGVGSWADEVWV